MQPYSQEVMDTVLSLIPHENHRKLATMLMNGTSEDEIKTHGFDDLQIEQYKSLIASVVSGETPLKEAPKEETTDTPAPAPAPETVEETPTTEETTQPEETQTQPETTEPVATEETTPTQPEATQPEATEPVENAEIPA